MWNILWTILDINNHEKAFILFMNHVYLTSMILEIVTYCVLIILKII